MNRYEMRLAQDLRIGDKFLFESQYDKRFLLFGGVVTGLLFSRDHVVVRCDRSIYRLKRACRCKVEKKGLPKP